MKRLANALIILAFLSQLVDARDGKAKREFQRENPCPVTNKRRGACPGYQIDHVVPLKCGGADKPSNMQWLTVQQHKEKTAREAKQCRKKTSGTT